MPDTPMTSAARTWTEDSVVTFWVRAAALHLRGTPRLLDREGGLLDPRPWSVLRWLEERAQESITMGFDRWAFRG